MQKFISPLNNLKIAAPCEANWDEMYGDARKRHCSECQLNVYNLSEMTQPEAESFLISLEGRVCVKFYRRRDGTILTHNCPVGLAKLKRKVSRAAAGFFALIAGFFGGLTVFNRAVFGNSDSAEKSAVQSEISAKIEFKQPAGIDGNSTTNKHVLIESAPKEEGMYMGQAVIYQEVKNVPRKFRRK